MTVALIAALISRVSFVTLYQLMEKLMNRYPLQDERNNLMRDIRLSFNFMIQLDLSLLCVKGSYYRLYTERSSASEIRIINNVQCIVFRLF